MVLKLLRLNRLLGLQFRCYARVINFLSRRTILIADPRGDRGFPPLNRHESWYFAFLNILDGKMFARATLAFEVSHIHMLDPDLARPHCIFYQVNRTPRLDLHFKNYLYLQAWIAGRAGLFTGLLL